MKSFGAMRDGRAASLWTLRARGLEIDVTDFGATLVAVRVPDRAGAVADVVLGFDDVAGYESADNQFFGGMVGRVANRIAGASFELDGRTHRLAANDGRHHLHGGPRGFDKVLWRGAASENGVRFTLRSPDGDEGFPGNVDVVVDYEVLPGARLRITISAVCDRRTPFCVTNHAYWNLAGAGAPTVLDHELRIAADAFTAVDDELIPTGELTAVRGTPFDFTTPRAIGDRIGELLGTPSRGYDHDFVLRANRAPEAAVAELRDPASGRWMRITTSEPGLQLYTGNHLRGQRGKAGRSYGAHGALCLETQHFPDSVHQPTFPSTILEPGRRATSVTTWTFGAE